MADKMDAIDQKLIKLIGKGAQQSSYAIAKQLNMSPATIRRRKRRLIKKDILRIAGIVDPDKIGLPLAVVIGFDVNHENLRAVTDKLASHPEVKWVSITTGRFDIMAQMRFTSTNELSAFITDTISNIEGLKNSETFVCLDVRKGRHLPLYLDENW